MKPTSGDFVTLVRKDLEMLGMSYEEATSSDVTKKILKTVATSVAFKNLYSTLKTHTKVNDIQYEALKIQPYLKSPLISTKEAIMLTSLRSHCVRGVKTNFSHFYKDHLDCPLQCNPKNPLMDTQEHILTCKILHNLPNMEETNIKYIYGTTIQQQKIAQTFCHLIKKREKVLESLTQCLPEASFPDQSPMQQQQQGTAAGQSQIVMQLG